MKELWSLQQATNVEAQFTTMIAKSEKLNGTQCILSTFV